jgi:hypothetical protein
MPHSSSFCFSSSFEGQVELVFVSVDVGNFGQRQFDGLLLRSRSASATSIANSSAAVMELGLTNRAVQHAILR